MGFYEEILAKHNVPPPIPLETYFPPLELPPVGSHPVWWPINSCQQAILNSRAELVLGGGSSGMGKTQTLCADAAQEYKNGHLRALVLRTTLIEQQELEDIQQKMYEPKGARWVSRRGRRAWVFPSGGVIRPGYLASDKDLKQYTGNPISYLGVDDSQQHPEDRVRRLLAWLTAPIFTGLRVRARFMANPGDIGHAWQMKVFLRGKCPVHYPADITDDRPLETSTVPGKVYKGASWTDDLPVMKTTAFFPARMIDNPFYGETKLTSLLSQTRKLQLQLLHGCWCDAEGLYFDFLRPQDQIAYPTIGDAWWWNHFISIDFGFGNSAAAAGLYAVNPSGKVFKTRERIERKMSSKEFARRLCTEGFDKTDSPKQGPQNGWLKKMRPRDPERPRINFVVMDRAMNQHHGSSDKSNFQIMEDVFTEHGIPCIKWDSKNSMGNAQNLYNGLQSGGIVITRDCPQTFQSLQTRVIDERKSVKKIHGSHLDDLYDETAGGYNTFCDDSEKPARTALEEEMEKLKKDGLDETSIARIRWHREQTLKDQETEKARGIRLGGPRRAPRRR